MRNCQCALLFKNIAHHANNLRVIRATFRTLHMFKITIFPVSESRLQFSPHQRLVANALFRVHLREGNGGRNVRGDHLLLRAGLVADSVRHNVEVTGGQ